jgi:hypothetical protein
MLVHSYGEWMEPREAHSSAGARNDGSPGGGRLLEGPSILFYTVLYYSVAFYLPTTGNTPLYVPQNLPNSMGVEIDALPRTISMRSHLSAGKARSIDRSTPAPSHHQRKRVVFISLPEVHSLI